MEPHRKANQPRWRTCGVLCGVLAFLIAFAVCLGVTGLVVVSLARNQPPVEAHEGIGEIVLGLYECGFGAFLSFGIALVIGMRTAVWMSRHNSD
jgi:hypothetical protein